MFVAIAVVSRGSDLPGPDELDSVVSTDALLYVCVLVATFLLGIGEVLYDNCAQTLMPSLVRADQLEKANGRLWAAQEAANQFAGPPLGSLLLAAGFAVPFLVDAGSFVVSAALISTIALAPRRRRQPVAARSWREELVEGVRWLWHNELLRTMAIILGLFNAAASITFSVYVLFAQEILGASTGEFAAIMMAGAAGAIIGGWTASSLSRTLGSGPSLAVALGGSAAGRDDIGLMSNVPAVAAMNLARRPARRAVERDHGEPAAVDHPRSPARPGEQRLPLLCLGHDPDRRHRRRRDRRPSPSGSATANWRCGCRGSSPAAIEIGLLVYAAPRLTTRRMEAARAARPLARPT